MHDVGIAGHAGVTWRNRTRKEEHGRIVPVVELHDARRWSRLRDGMRARQ
jgi:hypothetical protein